MSENPPIPELLRAWASRLGGDAALQSLSDMHPVFRVSAPGGEFILKEAGRINPQHDMARKLAAEYDLLCYLQERGIPVAVPQPADDGQNFFHSGDSFFVLLPVLPHAPAAKDDPRRVFHNIGAAIARLHRALAAYPGPIYSWTMDLPPRILDEAVSQILSHQPSEQNEKLLRVIDALREPLRRHLTGLPSQHIHGDCHSGNVLRVGEQVTGFIDLDHLPLGPRVYDLSYHLTGEVVGRFRDPAAGEQWLNGSIPSLFAGYQQEIPLAPSEKDAVPYMMMGICLIMAGWLFEHNILADITRDNLDLFFWLYENKARVRAAVG